MNSSRLYTFLLIAQSWKIHWWNSVIIFLSTELLLWHIMLKLNALCRENYIYIICIYIWYTYIYIYLYDINTQHLFGKMISILNPKFTGKYLHRLFWNSKRQLCFFFSGEIKGFTSNHRREIWRLSNLQFWIWKLSLSLVDTFRLCETVYS